MDGITSWSKPFCSASRNACTVKGLLFRLERQLYCKRRALADETLHPNPPVVLFDDLPADTESQPGAAVAVLVGLLGGKERLENDAQLLGRNADSRVADADF